MAFFGVVAQRILAHQPVGQVHVDMGAGAERRQQAAICRGQLEAADTLRFIVTGYHYGIDHVGCSSGRVALVAISCGCGARSLAMIRSSTLRDCTPPASMFSFSKLRSG